MLAAVATGLGVPAAAQGAATRTVADSFGSSASGWTSSIAQGGLCLVLTCPTGSGAFRATGGSAGAGDGYLHTDFTSGIGVRVTWRSTPFTAGAVDQATLSAAVRTQSAACWPCSTARRSCG